MKGITSISKIEVSWEDWSCFWQHLDFFFQIRYDTDSVLLPVSVASMNVLSCEVLKLHPGAGFGRIGRLVLRAALQRDDIEVQFCHTFLENLCDNPLQRMCEQCDRPSNPFCKLQECLVYKSCLYQKTLFFVCSNCKMCLYQEDIAFRVSKVAVWMYRHF